MKNNESLVELSSESRIDLLVSLLQMKLEVFHFFVRLLNEAMRLCDDFKH